MKITQNDNSMFIKGLDNVEAKTLSTVKRFFDRDPKEIEGSIDYLILEVLRRVKEDILDGSFITSVASINGQRGDVTLTASDLGAEPEFNKLSAFNKEFGDKAKTVCEGNDPRLSDSREPLKHNHEEYLTSDDIDQAVEDFLKRKGISFTTSTGEQEVITITNKNLIVVNGEFVEDIINE